MTNRKNRAKLTGAITRLDELAALTMSQLRNCMKPQAAFASLIKRRVNITIRIGMRHVGWRRDLVL
jgi:hypothetical protein